MSVDGNILTIKVDLAKDFGPSSSGKTILKNKDPSVEDYTEISILRDNDIENLPNIKLIKRKTKDLYSGKNNIFEIHISESNQEIINKLFLNSFRFEEIAEIRTGVMGFDYWSISKFIREGKFDGGIRIATNGFIDRYLFTWGTKARLYKRDFYNPFLDIKGCTLSDNTKDSFINKKIIIRGVAQKLSVNLDDDGIGILVGVHSAVINNTLEYNPKYIMSILNSPLLNVYHLLKFYIARIPEGSLKYPISFLKTIPIKNISYKEQMPFVGLVDQILSLTNSPDYLDSPEKQARVKILEKEIDQLVYKLYDLTPEEIAVVENFNKVE